MADTLKRVPLSESGDSYSSIDVGSAATTARVDIHTPPDNAVDEVWLWASNQHTSTDTVVWIEWGAPGSVNQFRQTIDNGAGLHLICNGLTISGSSNTITAYVNPAVSGTNIHGHVNRTTWL